MVVRGSKETRIVLFLSILRVLVPYLQSYFRVKISCKLDFVERISKIIVSKFESFLLNLKLDFNKQKDIYAYAYIYIYIHIYTYTYISDKKRMKKRKIPHNIPKSLSPPPSLSRFIKS